MTHPVILTLFQNRVVNQTFVYTIAQPSGYFGNAGGDFNWPGQQQQQSQQPQSHSFNNHQQSGATGGQQQLRNSNSNNAFSTTAFNNNSNSLTGGQPSSNRSKSALLCYRLLVVIAMIVQLTPTYPDSHRAIKTRPDKSETGRSEADCIIKPQVRMGGLTEF